MTHNVARLSKQIEEEVGPSKFEDMQQIRRWKNNIRALDPNAPGDRELVERIRRDIVELRIANGMAADGADDLPWD
ncbi:MAG: hypothetical protein ACJA07_001521 [Rhodococcus sp. (in: high G+C Gram-positive bacteria)]|jgi:hypothetical protein